MSVIPSKFNCDADGCNAMAQELGEAGAKHWLIVSLSSKDNYVAINKWERLSFIPSHLELRHACSKAHAIEILKDFMLLLD